MCDTIIRADLLSIFMLILGFGLIWIGNLK